MLDDKAFFLCQIRRENGKWDKGIVVKETYDAACQSMYAYLGAYGFGNKETVDYCCCFVTDFYGSLVVHPVTWWAQPEKPTETEEGIA